METTTKSDGCPFCVLEEMGWGFTVINNLQVLCCIKCKKPVPPPQKGNKRWKVLKRDNFTCQYCGDKAPHVKLEVDHKTSKYDGGDDTEENLITSCRACNNGKREDSLDRIL